MKAEDPWRMVRRFFIYLAAVAVLHTVAMVELEGLPPWDALWLTLSTVTTVGYGDLVAQTPAGRLATIVFIYLGGIFVLFEAAAAYFDYRADRRRRMLSGTWRWEMQGHILILDTPANNPGQHLERLVRELRASRRYGDLLVLVVSQDFPGGLPEPLLALGVVHNAATPADPQALENAGVAQAAVIIVLARNDSDRLSDSRTFDILHRLREMGAKGRTLAEAVEDANRPRLREAGADIVVRPLRGYPEMVIRALVAPGAEQLIEDLFTSRLDECWRYDVRVRDRRWCDVVRRLVECDIGIPIGYRRAADKTVACNPRPEERIDADKLYVIVREGNNRPDAEVERLLAQG